MTKKESLKEKSRPVGLPAQEESGDQIFRTVRGGFYESIAEVLRAARSNAYRAVNFVMVESYWRIGRMIVEEERQGKERAEYGSYLLKDLSARLTSEFGKGFNEANLRYIRQFYLTYPIRHALRDELSAGVESDRKEARAIRDSARHESAKASSGSDQAEGIVHTLRAELTWTQAIIGKLQAFMLELGKGFAFGARQHRISTGDEGFLHRSGLLRLHTQNHNELLLPNS